MSFQILIIKGGGGSSRNVRRGNSNPYKKQKHTQNFSEESTIPTYRVLTNSNAQTAIAECHTSA